MYQESLWGYGWSIFSKRICRIKGDSSITLSGLHMNAVCLFKTESTS
jgi:hypothetical protein